MANENRTNIKKFGVISNKFTHSGASTKYSVIHIIWKPIDRNIIDMF